MPKIGRREQMNAEKERDPARIDAEDQCKSTDRFVQHDNPSEPIGQSQGCEELSGARHSEYENFEIEAVEEKQDAHAHSQ